jgi:hypothetical protein
MHIDRKVALFVLLGLIALGAGVRADDNPQIPDGLKGFSGTLRGTVTEVHKDGKAFHIEVTKVVNVWRKNTAPNPDSAVGETLLINAQWEKRGGQWRPVENHVRFIHSLRVGEEVDVEVTNDEGERLHILELTQAQRARGAR